MANKERPNKESNREKMQKTLHVIEWRIPIVSIFINIIESI